MKTQPLIPYYRQHRELKGISPESLRIAESILNRFAAALPELPEVPAPIFRYLGTIGKTYGTRSKARDVLSTFYAWVCGSYEIENPMPQVKVPKRRAKNGTPQPPPHPPTPTLLKNTADIADAASVEAIAQRVAQVLQGNGLSAPYQVGPAPELRTAQAIDDFVAELRHGAKPTKESTIYWYLLPLNRFKEQYPTLPMDGTILGRFIGTASSDKHRHTYSRVIVTFYKTLSRLYSWKRQGIFNPIEEMQRISEIEAEVPPLQADELERLLGTMGQADLDTRLLHLLLLTTGLRPTEIVNLETKDFFDTRIQVRGKTKPRIVELIPELAGQLKALSPQGGRVFKKLPQKVRVQEATKAMLQKANVRGGAGGGRLFRHTFACWLYSETGDLKLVKDVLGHTKLDMSIRYATQRMARTASAPLWYDLIKVAAACHKGERPQVPQAIADLLNGTQTTGQKVLKPMQLSKEFQQTYGGGGMRDSGPDGRKHPRKDSEDQEDYPEAERFEGSSQGRLV